MKTTDDLIRESDPSLIVELVEAIEEEHKAADACSEHRKNPDNFYINDETRHLEDLRSVARKKVVNIIKKMRHAQI